MTGARRSSRWSCSRAFAAASVFVVSAACPALPPRTVDPAQLAAERALAAAHAAGELPGVERVVTIAELGDWEYTDGLAGMPERLRELSGRRVAMVGFLLPIDGQDAILVRALWRDGHHDAEPAPEIHELVHVTMPSDVAIDWRRRARVLGTFTVGATVLDGYCVDVWQLRADEVRFDAAR